MSRCTAFAGSFVLLVVAVLLAQPARAVAQSTDPAAVYNAWTAAVNAGDVAGAAALYTADAVITLEPPAPGVAPAISGEGQISLFLQGLVAQGVRIEPQEPAQVSRDMATRHETHLVFEGPVLEILNKAEVKGDQFSAMTLTVLHDATPTLPGGAATAHGIGLSGYPPAPSIPKSGAAGASIWAALLAAATLFCTGLWLRLRHDPAKKVEEYG